MLLAQKFCNGGSGPYTLQCFSKTGVVMRNANIMFVYRNDGNKNCEANTVRNVTETIYNFQRYCDIARDTRTCTLEPNFIRSVFQTQELANDQYYPIRMELKFDCLGMQIYSLFLMLFIIRNIFFVPFLFKNLNTETVQIHSSSASCHLLHRL